MSGWALALTKDDGIELGVVPWRMRGTTYVTAVVKATFELRHEAAALRRAPRPLVLHDAPHDPADARSSLRAGCELAPYLARADVTLVGHAHAPARRPSPIGVVRLALLCDETPLFDASIRIYGDRPPGAAAPRPFTRMPLVYERAFGGPDHPVNPVGRGSRGEARPNLVDPSDPQRPACLGPLASSWPCRAQLLAAAPPMRRSGPVLELPEPTPWEYFQAAPPRQRTDYLRGDEWVVLEGVHPELARVASRLPGVRGAARLTGPGLERPVELGLVADGLAIDADAMTVDLLWRGYAALPAGVELGRLTLHGGLVPCEARAGDRAQGVAASAGTGPASSRATFDATAPGSQPPVGPATPFRPGAAPAIRLVDRAAPPIARSSFGETVGMTSGQHRQAAVDVATPYAAHLRQPEPETPAWQQEEAPGEAGAGLEAAPPLSVAPGPVAPPPLVAPAVSVPAPAAAPAERPAAATEAAPAQPVARAAEPVRPRTADEMARHAAASGLRPDLAAALLAALRPPPPAPETDGDSASR
ncbi:MAG: DUF2169 domain-containing protein [Polyangiaceae bacterium]|nr:DUF2169 domain-containing protein [Polyangiaceae bacterium]